jgi:hypothetical protein
VTKKDYVLIAKAISEVTEAFSGPCHPHPGTIVGRIADYLQRDNGRFDRSKFLKACGVNK